MGLLNRLFARISGVGPGGRPDGRLPAAVALYSAIVAQSRQPGFYTGLAVPDTPDGRFDVLMVHAALVLRRLRRDHALTEKTAQALFDLMFDDMDENLREMGVGDLAVGKRVKGMAKALYGRLAAYGDALDADDRPGLAAALARNVYRASEGQEAAARALAAYMFEAAGCLDRLPAASLAGGAVMFPAAPTEA